MTKPLRLSPYLLLTLANLFWAGNWVVRRAFRDELPPAALSFWRWVVALLCLLPLALPHVWRDWSRLSAAWPRLLLFGALGTGLVFLTPFYLWEIARDRHVIVTPGSIAGIVYTGIFPAFLGYILWNRAVADVGAARAGLFMHLVPAFGIVLSMMLLNEQPAVYHAIGIGLIFCGIWLNTRRLA